MNALEIAARANAKPSVKGKWLGPCPAHDDRRPSLTIAEGRDGRVLLHCFAGCGAESIARALGVSMRDLFEGNTPSSVIERRTRPTVAELCRALAIEEQRYREWHGIEGLLRTSEVNDIRATIAKRYGIELGPIARPLYEGAYGGRERDVAWPALFDWALFVASVRLLGAPTAFNEPLFPPSAVLVEAEELAAAAMRSLERDARHARTEAAA